MSDDLRNTIMRLKAEVDELQRRMHRNESEILSLQTELVRTRDQLNYSGPDAATAVKQPRPRRYFKSPDDQRL